MFCFWHLADIRLCTAHVCFRGQSGHRSRIGKCPLMTQAEINCYRVGALAAYLSLIVLMSASTPIPSVSGNDT